MKRRSMVLSLGALATGSGAMFTSAGLSNTATGNSTLEVYSVGELNARPGSAQDGDLDYASDYTPIENGSDLPAASVSGNTQGTNDLKVKAATKNNGEDYTFEYLLEVENDGTESADIGIGFSSFGSLVGTDTSSEGTDVLESDVLDMYNFEVNVSLSGNVSSGDDNISPTSGTTDAQTPKKYKTVPAGEYIAIDLSITPPSGIVGDIRSATGGAGKTFNGSNTSGVTLLDEITIGTDNN